MAKQNKLQASANLRRRYRAEKRFKAYCIGALGMALLFLVLFFETTTLQNADKND